VAGLVAAISLIAILFGFAVIKSSLRFRDLVASDRADPAKRLHPTLGELRWDSIMLAWTGQLGDQWPLVVSCLFSGTRDEGPDERLIAACSRCTAAALEFLATEARLSGKTVNPDELVLKQVVRVKGR